VPEERGPLLLKGLMIVGFLVNGMVVLKILGLLQLMVSKMLLLLIKSL